MAEDNVKQLTGMPPSCSAISGMTSINAVPVHDDKDQISRTQTRTQTQDLGIIKPGLPETVPTTSVDDTAHGVVAPAKLSRTASMQRVASLEHLQKRICGGVQNSTDPQSSGNKQKKKKHG